MSGWCSYCSSESEDGIYICSQCEETEIAEIEEIQEQNKIMREALEKISTDTVEVGFYVEPTWSAQIAREALAKVEE